MKILKKLVGSIIITAIGCLLLLPKETIAEEVNCNGVHSYQPMKEEHSVTTTIHPYLCGTIEQEDGTEEYVYQNCTITITIDRFQQECSVCKKLLAQQGSGEKRVHSIRVE